MRKTSVFILIIKSVFKLQFPNRNGLRPLSSNFHQSLATHSSISFYPPSTQNIYAMLARAKIHYISSPDNYQKIPMNKLRKKPQYCLNCKKA